MLHTGAGWRARQSLLGESFWLVITDREDLGVDLNASAERETGGVYWRYAFGCGFRLPRLSARGLSIGR